MHDSRPTARTLLCVAAALAIGGLLPPGYGAGLGGGLALGVAAYKASGRWALASALLLLVAVLAPRYAEAQEDGPPPPLCSELSDEKAQTFMETMWAGEEPTAVPCLFPRPEIDFDAFEPAEAAGVIISLVGIYDDLYHALEGGSDMGEHAAGLTTIAGVGGAMYYVGGGGPASGVGSWAMLIGAVSVRDVFAVIQNLLHDLYFEQWGEWVDDLHRWLFPDHEQHGDAGDEPEEEAEYPVGPDPELGLQAGCEACCDPFPAVELICPAATNGNLTQSYQDCVDDCQFATGRSS